MRRLFLGMVVAAATAVAPLWAMAANQEVAEKIAANLRKSGELQGFKIGVKFENGTAWLSGRVRSEDQLQAAVKLVSETAGVKRVVNQLKVNPSSGATLKQTAGALGPDQVLRPISTDLMIPSAPRNTADRLSQVATAAGTLQAASRAERTASSFTQVPARLAATQLIPTGGYPKAIAASQPKPISQSRPRPYTTAKAERARPAQTKPATPKQTGKFVPVQQPFVAVPMPVGYMQQPSMPVMGQPMPVMGQPMPQYMTPVGGGVAPVRYDQPHLPSYSWPSYASYPNYAALTYPKQYSPTAWPYIGPFYPYPQVPLGWRKVVLEWHDGWWHLDFDDGGAKGGPLGALFRPPKKHRR
jgi:hypothetical protein